MRWNAVDAVRSEPGPCAVHESDCRISFFIVERFGVGQPGVVIDRRMQVDVAGLGPCSRGPGYGLRLGAAFAVDSPAAAVGDASDLLYVDTDHVSGPPRDDAP